MDRFVCPECGARGTYNPWKGCARCPSCGYAPSPGGNPSAQAGELGLGEGEAGLDPKDFVVCPWCHQKILCSPLAPPLHCPACERSLSVEDDPLIRDRSARPEIAWIPSGGPSFVRCPTCHLKIHCSVLDPPPRCPWCGGSLPGESDPGAVDDQRESAASRPEVGRGPFARYALYGVGIVVLAVGLLAGGSFGACPISSPWC